MAIKKENAVSEKSADKQVAAPAPATEAAPVAPTPAIKVEVAQPKSSSNSCLTIALIGCGCAGCLTVLLVAGAIIFFVIAGNMAKNSITGAPKTSTGVPVFVTDTLEKFIGNTKEGRDFINVLKNGVTQDMLKDKNLPNTGSSGGYTYPDNQSTDYNYNNEPTITPEE